MHQRPYRLYSVVCNLAIAILALPLLLLLLRSDTVFMLFWNGLFAWITLAAVLLGVVCPHRSDKGLSKPRKVFFAVLAIPAALQLFVTGWWIVYASGIFGYVHYIRFGAAIRDADRIVIRDGGGGCCGANPDKEPALYVITNKAEMAKFNSMFKFAGVNPRCMCCGYPGVDWWKGDKRLVLTAIHHGRALRWSGFGGVDVRFMPESARRIRDWFKEHCDIDIKEKGGIPIYVRCEIIRDKALRCAERWTKSHDGRKPSLDDLRQEMPEELFCPRGGTYSLTYDEKGSPVVTCSAPGHDSCRFLRRSR